MEEGGEQLKLPLLKKADVDITVKIKDDLSKNLGRIQKDALFAASKALNSLAYGAARNSEKHLRQKLQIKTKYAGRVRYKKSNKRDLTVKIIPQLQALEIQETGGIVKPRAKRTAVPTKVNADKRPSAKVRRLRKLFQDIHTRSPGRAAFYYQPKGVLSGIATRKKSKPKYPIEVEFLLPEVTKYSKRTLFYKNVRTYANRHLPQKLKAEIRKLLRKR